MWGWVLRPPPPAMLGTWGQAGGHEVAPSGCDGAGDTGGRCPQEGSQCSQGGSRCPHLPAGTPPCCLLLGAQCVGDGAVLGAQVLLLLHAWGGGSTQEGLMGHPLAPPGTVQWVMPSPMDGETEAQGARHSCRAGWGGASC